MSKYSLFLFLLVSGCVEPGSQIREAKTVAQAWAAELKIPVRTVSCVAGYGGRQRCVISPVDDSPIFLACNAYDCVKDGGFKPS